MVKNTFDTKSMIRVTSDEELMKIYDLYKCNGSDVDYLLDEDSGTQRHYLKTDGVIYIQIKSDYMMTGVRDWAESELGKDYTIVSFEEGIRILETYIRANDSVTLPADQMAQPKKEGYITKDSGKRQEFSTGMKRDTSDDKPMYHLLIPLEVPTEEQRLYKVFKGTDNELIVRNFLTWYLGESNSQYILSHITIGKGIEDFAWLLTRGAVKYEARNREKAKTLEEFNRFVESACRHFFQYIFEINTEEDHKSATAFNIMGADMVKFKLNQVK